MLIKLNNLKLNQINLSSSTKKIIFLVPPLLLASYYVGKRYLRYYFIKIFCFKVCFLEFTFIGN